MPRYHFIWTKLHAIATNNDTCIFMIERNAQTKESVASFNYVSSEMSVIRGMNFPVTQNLFQKKEERRKINPINQSIVNKEYQADKGPKGSLSPYRSQRCR